MARMADQTRQCDIIDWLVEAINQFAAGGYQEAEKSDAVWLKNEVEIHWHAGGVMMVRDKNGVEFRINVTKVKQS